MEKANIAVNTKVNKTVFIFYFILLYFIFKCFILFAGEQWCYAL